MAETNSQDKQEAPDAQAALQFLAEKLGHTISFEGSNCAIATSDQVAKAKMHDNSLEATVFPNATVEIESPRAPGIDVELIDHNDDKFVGAPPDAIYRIRTYAPKRRMRVGVNGKKEPIGYKESLKGVAYIGNEGFIKI